MGGGASLGVGEGIVGGGEGDGVVLVHGHVEADLETARGVGVHARLASLALRNVVHGGGAGVGGEEGLRRGRPVGLGSSGAERRAHAAQPLVEDLEREKACANGESSLRISALEFDLGRAGWRRGRLEGALAKSDQKKGRLH